MVMDQLQGNQRVQAAISRPGSLVAAGWLSYGAALVLIALDYRLPVRGFLLAGPWFLLGLGLMAGAPSAWRGALAVAGFYGVLATLLLTSSGVVPQRLVMEAQFGLGFLAVYVVCLAAPSTRQFIRDTRSANIPPEL